MLLSPVIFLIPARCFPPLRCVFTEAFAKIGGDAFLNDAAEEARKRRCDRDQDPEQRGEDETSNRDGFHRDGNTVGLAQTKVHGEDVGDQFNTVDDEGGEQERGDRKGADADEKNVDRAGDALTPAAMTAIGEMLVVVCPHGRREPRYVITPSGEDISYHLIDARGVMGPAVRWKC